MAAITATPAAFTTQRLEALEHANQIRRVRAVFKRRLAAQSSASRSRRLCAELLEAQPPALVGMPVTKLLTGCRGTGVIAASKLLRAAGIRDQASVGSLTTAQRHQLIGALRMAA